MKKIYFLFFLLLSSCSSNKIQGNLDNDFIFSDNVFIITAKPTNTVDVSDKLIEKGYNVISSGIEMVPKNTLNVKGDDIKKLINLIEHLEEHDDIQNIYSNFEVDDAEI